MEDGKRKGEKSLFSIFKVQNSERVIFGISPLPSSTHLLTLLLPSSALHVQPIDVCQSYITPVTPHANISSVSLTHQPKTHILSVDELS